MTRIELQRIQSLRLSDYVELVDAVIIELCCITGYVDRDVVFVKYFLRNEEIC